MKLISCLYKIDDTVVFYSLADSYKLAELLKNGTSFTDVFGKALEQKDANYEYALLTGQFRPRNDLERIYRNTELANVIISIVRTELMNIEDGTTLLMELQPAIELATVGMFTDASNYILSLIPSGNFTDDQLNRWSDLLLSSNCVEEI